MVACTTLDDRLEYPILSLHSQSGPSLCGIAAIRSVLETQFDAKASEDEVVRTIGRRKGWPQDEYWSRIKRYGTSPTDIADYFKRGFSGVKVFCSRQGKASQLDHLLRKEDILPIFHQQVTYREEGELKTDGHYMIFGGLSKGIAQVFNPSLGVGFSYLEVNNFHRQWLNHEERWYLAVVPDSLHLPAEKFKGRYL